MARRRLGFTLIELLVVIAIIAILAAMLFPVFARARESARKIQCLSNVKNIATAVQMYLTDYDKLPPGEHRQEAWDLMDEWCQADFGCTPGYGRVNWANPFLRWPVILDEYVRNREVWVCPSARLEMGMYWIVPNYMGDYLRYQAATHGSLWKMGGGMEGGNACNTAYPPGWGGDVTDSIGQQAGNLDGSNQPGAFVGSVGCTSYGNRDVKTSQITDPSWFVVAGDTAWFGGVIAGPSNILYQACCVRCGGADWVNCPETQDCGLPADLWEKFWTDSDYRKTYTRHMGGSNIGFADGHAAWWHGDALLAQTEYCGPLPPDGCCVFQNVGKGKIEGLCGKM